MSIARAPLAAAAKVVVVVGVTSGHIYVARALALSLVLIPTLWLEKNSYSQDGDDESGKVDSHTLVYSDDDSTTVVTSSLDATVAVSDKLSATLYGLVDAVSTASVDVTSAATGRWTETRVEAGLELHARVSDGLLSLGIVRSEENDWRSLTVRVSSEREFFQRNTKVSASLGFTANEIGRAEDPSFEESLTALSLELGISQLLDAKTRISGSYSHQSLLGFQSSPYRYVRTLDRVSVPERHPRTRRRHSLSGQLVRSLHEIVSVRAGYRLYRDDWGIWSHTGSLGLRLWLANRIGVSLDGRLYQQNKADFYQNHYPTTFRYMSSDRELSTFRDVSGTLGLQASVGPLELKGKAGLIQYRFENFDRLPKRRAYLFGGGATLRW